MEHKKEILQVTPASDIIVIDDDDDKKNTYQPYNKNREHCKDKRKVMLSRFENMETLVVTQKVEVRKKKIKCTVNLTKKKRVNIDTGKRSYKVERIVPRCFRKCPNRLIDSKRSKPRTRSKHVIDKKIPKTKCHSNNYSPLSLSSLSLGSEMNYEDVSSDSLNFDDDIDTLIKRTKDRERRTSKSSFENLPMIISTPRNFESILISDSDGDETLIIERSEKTPSLHSTATLILDTKPEKYTPSHSTASPDTNNDHDIKMTEIDQNNTLNEDLIAKENAEVKSAKRKFSPETAFHDNEASVDNDSEEYTKYTNIKDSFGQPANFIDSKDFDQHINNTKSETESILCFRGSINLPYEVYIKFDSNEMKTENSDVFEDNCINNKVENGPNLPLEYMDVQRTNTDRNLHGVESYLENDKNVCNENNNIYVKSVMAEKPQKKYKVKEEK